MSLPPGYLETGIGLVLLFIGGWFLVWINTSSEAGYLMIIGALMMLGAFLLVILGTLFLFGGVWTLWPLPDPAVGRALGFIVGIPLAVKLSRWRRRRGRGR